MVWKAFLLLSQVSLLLYNCSFQINNHFQMFRYRNGGGRAHRPKDADCHAVSKAAKNQKEHQWWWLQVFNHYQKSAAYVDSGTGICLFTTCNNAILCSPDDTDNINKIISSNSPESCLTYLTNLEKKGDPHVDHVLLHKLMDCYTQVFSNMPLGKYCQNQSYARMLVRFAELKA